MVQVKCVSIVQGTRWVWRAHKLRSLASGRRGWTSSKPPGQVVFLGQTNLPGPWSQLGKLPVPRRTPNCPPSTPSNSEEAREGGLCYAGPRIATASHRSPLSRLEKLYSGDVQLWRNRGGL
jgi:hypothetical protein